MQRSTGSARMGTVDFTAPAPPGYHACTINGQQYYGIDGMEMRASSDGTTFSHRHLDMVTIEHSCKTCGEKCGHFDIDRQPARSFAEALERGYFIRAADVTVHDNGTMSVRVPS